MGSKEQALEIAGNREKREGKDEEAAGEEYRDAEDDFTADFTGENVTTEELEEQNRLEKPSLFQLQKMNQ